MGKAEKPLWILMKIFFVLTRVWNNLIPPSGASFGAFSPVFLKENLICSLYFALNF